MPILRVCGDHRGTKRHSFCNIFCIPFRVRERVANDWGLGSGFCWVLRFRQLLTTGLLHISLNMAETVMIIEIQNSKFDMPLLLLGYMLYCFAIQATPYIYLA